MGSLHSLQLGSPEGTAGWGVLQIARLILPCMGMPGFSRPLLASGRL